MKSEKGVPALELREHSKEDYISHCKPFKFTGEHGLPSSGDFAHYVKTREETMGPDGVVALKQLFGAAPDSVLPADLHRSRRIEHRQVHDGRDLRKPFRRGKRE